MLGACQPCFRGSRGFRFVFASKGPGCWLELMSRSRCFVKGRCPVGSSPYEYVSYHFVKVSAVNCRNWIPLANLRWHYWTPHRLRWTWSIGFAFLVHLSRPGVFLRCTRRPRALIGILPGQRRLRFGLDCLEVHSQRSLFLSPIDRLSAHCSCHTPNPNWSTGWSNWLDYLLTHLLGEQNIQFHLRCSDTHRPAVRGNLLFLPCPW